MNRRKFLKQMLYTPAGLCLSPILSGIPEASARGVQIRETYLRFLSLTNRTVTDMIVIHHVGGTDHEVSAAEIHRWHLHNGWAGIGYHYVIHKDGSIERGRPRDAVGAHCYGENDHTIGINLVGNFQVAVPTGAQLDAAAALVAQLCQIYRIRPGAGSIVGHRDLNSTECPGQNLYDQLPDLREAAASML